MVDHTTHLRTEGSEPRITCLMISLAGARQNAPKVGIILSDGVATREQEFTDDEAIAARNEGILLFGIGIGSEVYKFKPITLIAKDL